MSDFAAKVTRPTLRESGHLLQCRAVRRCQRDAREGRVESSAPPKLVVSPSPLKMWLG